MKRILKGTTANTVVSRIPFVLDADNASKVSEFIRTTDAKSFQPSIQFAFKNFEESYSTHSERQAFTSLMAAMEGLFHEPNVKEISGEIATKCSVLMGGSSAEQASVYSNLRRLYRKRSRILHGGSAEVVSSSDSSLLRDYVRQSIKKLIQSGDTKD